MKEPVEHRAAVVHSVDFTERTIELIVVPYGQETVVRDENGRPIREVVERGAFAGIEGRDDHVTVNRDHDHTRTIGKVVAYRDDPAGLIASVRVSETQLGDETLALARDGVLKASVGMVVRKGDGVVMRGMRRVKRAFVDHVALVPNPAYAGARVLAVRSQQATPRLDAVLGSDIGEWLQ